MRIFAGGGCWCWWWSGGGGVGDDVCRCVLHRNVIPGILLVLVCALR